jgi:ABC-type multidrug transport system fused ATPase/permease subunit
MKPEAHKKGFIFLARRLLSEIRQFGGRLFVSCVLLLFSSVIGLACSFLIGKYTDSVLSGPGAGRYSLLYWLAGLILASLVFSALNQYYWGRFYQQIAFELRKKTAGKMCRVGYPWIESQSAGDLTVRLNDDLSQLLNFYNQFRNNVSSFLIGILSFGYICYLNPLLAFGYLLFPCVMQIFLYFSSRALDPQFRKRQELFGGIAGCSQDFLNGVPEIKAMNLEKVFIAKYLDRVLRFTAHLIKLDKASSKTDTLLETLGFFQNILLLVLGGFMVFRGKITIGDLLVAQLLAGNISAAVKGLNFFQLRMGLASAFRVFELWDEKDAAGRECVSGGEIVLALRNISFTYPQRPETVVLKDVTIVVKPNQKAAIVGPSGSGKSSIVKLLAGFYRPDRGTVSLFQNNAGSLSMIEQDTVLFSDTFFNNIACGNPDFLNFVNNEKSLEETVVNSAKKAAIHDFIISTEQGYKSNCSVHGANLSGGQRQRISIARCLCRNADIVLLDEPTSALDRENEAEVMKSLNDSFTGKTVIMITHNIDLIKDFDIIYLVSGGEVIDSGTYSHLLQNKHFCELAREEK